MTIMHDLYVYFLGVISTGRCDLLMAPSGTNSTALSSCIKSSRYLNCRAAEIQSLGNSVGGDHEREFKHTKSLLADMWFDDGRSGVALTLDVDKQELKRSRSHERNMVLLLLHYREVVLGTRKDWNGFLKHTVRVQCRSQQKNACHCLEAFPCQ